ncbi:MAG: polyprenyl diphosphate synthase [Acholeplasmataceae bacterium]
MKIIKIPKHVAIILDGNGRWAKKKKKPRTYGHYIGGRNLFKVADIANEYGIEKLSVYAFSTENWKRPQEEVDYLMSFPVQLYEKNKDRIDEIKYKIEVTGRKDQIPKAFLDVIEDIVDKTKHNDGMVLNICLDYGAYDEIIKAINQSEKPVTKESLESNLMVKEPVDLLIRTSGEQRLSNFLLWQVSYAELYFTKVFWPAFNKKQFEKAMREYQKRQRRFGGLS